MPVSIELPTVKNRSRKYFGIPDDKYIFLCTFDFFSYIHRKNPWAVVNAFLKAFTTGSENVILVVKVMNGNEDDDGWQRLKEISLSLRKKHIEILSIVYSIWSISANVVNIQPIKGSIMINIY